MINSFKLRKDGLYIMVSTDPPYYDNVEYADLSDFFYVWMREALKETYPKLFRTMLVPKTEELVATPYRFDGSIEDARDFFESGMLETCKQIYKYSSESIPVTIYYAYKQSETDNEETNIQTSSTGWETMLTAIIRSGFAITGTWPLRTEQAYRAISMGTNALASSIVLVCRKRPENAPVCTRRNFINELKRELKPALQKLQRSNIAPVDLAQSAIGPGMGVYSRFGKVLEADGSPMTVRSALQIINQELDVFFNEQDGELDRDSRFCVDLYTQNAFNDIKFGDADTLARAKNTSVAALASSGVLYAQKGVVNESDGELVRWAYSSLARLSSFLDDVFNRANSLGEARIDYVRHYKDQIALLHSEIEQEYSSSLVEKALGDEMEREIQIILHSSNPSEAYHQLWVNKYYLQEDKTLLERFMRLASEAGIESASVGLAELYFDRADYTKAGDYYSAALSILTPPQKLNLASLYVSNLCIGHTPEEGMEIISSCESKNKPIVSYRTADGHTFYRYGRKQ